MAISISTKTAGLTILAMIAFAANSLFCRLALGPELADAATFTLVRIGSGAVTLAIILGMRGGPEFKSLPDFRMVAMLFVYMVFFSFAYISLAAGTGALILFGAVQLTMFIVALKRGEAFSYLSWFGLALAIAGLIYLVSPGVSAPDPVGAMLMVAAGVGWGFYSLLGRQAGDPLQATAKNFIYCVPLAVIVSLLFLADFHATPAGIVLAIASGALASGCGYVVWYAALPGLTATRAATVQLSVPVIAAAGGVILLSEPLSARLVVASAATLGGVFVVLSQRSAAPRRN